MVKTWRPSPTLPAGSAEPSVSTRTAVASVPANTGAARGASAKPTHAARRVPGMAGGLEAHARDRGGRPVGIARRRRRHLRPDGLAPSLLADQLAVARDDL